MGSVSELRSEDGERDVTTPATVNGASEAPEARGSTLPSATKATKSKPVEKGLYIYIYIYTHIYIERERESE